MNLVFIQTNIRGEFPEDYEDPEDVRITHTEKNQYETTQPML